MVLCTVFLSSFLFLTLCLFLERRSVTGIKIHRVGQDQASFISAANKTDLARGVRFFYRLFCLVSLTPTPEEIRLLCGCWGGEGIEIGDVF